MDASTLHGRVVGVTADRRASDQLRLLERRGARTVHGPTLGTAWIGDEEALRVATATVIASPPDVLVADTAVGVRSWLDAVASWEQHDEVLHALRRCRVVARGPKAAGAARRAGLTVGHVAGSEQLAEIVEHLLASGVGGLHVVVQEHGQPQVDVRRRLEAAGARVTALPVYRWRLPQDQRPAHRLIDLACTRELDAITFTSAPAVRNLLAMAEERGRDAELLAAFDGGVLAACVGPVCAAAAREQGIGSPVWPEVGRLGNMIRVLEHALGGRRPRGA